MFSLARLGNPGLTLKVHTADGAPTEPPPHDCCLSIPQQPSLTVLCALMKHWACFVPATRRHMSHELFPSCTNLITTSSLHQGRRTGLVKDERKDHPDTPVWEVMIMRRASPVSLKALWTKKLLQQKPLITPDVEALLK